MAPTIELLDAWKLTKGLQSDYAAAAELGVSRVTVSRWRNGGAHPEPALIERMAKAVGRPVLRALAEIEAERATSPANRAVWRRLASAAAILLGIVAGGYTAPAAAAVAALRIMSNWSGRSVNYLRDLWLMRCN